jgi:hypothetical protein
MRPLLAISAVFILASCSVKKRTYRDGYYIDWAFQKKASKHPSIISDTQVKSAQKEVVETENITASRNSEEIISASVKRIVIIDTCGDVITFKSGDQVTARVTEITDDKIKYKRCDNLDGPVFVVNKGTVETIRYANGVVEKIDAPQVVQAASPNNAPNNDRNNYKGPKKVHPYATTALLCLLLLWWLFGIGIILGAVFGYLAVKEIDRDPSRYRGRKLAKIVYGISIGIITFFLALFAFSFLLFI